MQKPQRWYEIQDDTAFIYDAPTSAQAVSVSIVRKSDLSYYRRNFQLHKVWTTQ
jgi:hypothetical protein